MRIKKPILSIFFFLLGLATTFAQGGGPPSPPDFEGDIPVPIDDHVWVLIVVAIVVGVFILKFQKTQTSK
ncbi:hypothetical protein [Psychroflexus lacisalsi]|jgi:hypothetical protein|uniref:Signal peptidase n=1 Tax=Psychroflexus lacisalsi TaxID=503928 RepID=A0ABN1K1C3_9FLAO|nr:hypothetical protein [Psychroflexus lacisalsi]MBZ9620806.1 hypothetical protein [Psychroflexus lacisalsi]